MADEEMPEEWSSEEFPLSTGKTQNDPWSPEQTIPKLSSAPIDPLRSMISSETYIESLEKKLQRLKGKTVREVKASDMIQTLQTAKEIHVAQFLGTDHSDICFDDTFEPDSSVMHSIQRRLNPDKQAVNPVELVPLVNADLLAKVTEESETESLNTEQGLPRT